MVNPLHPPTDAAAAALAARARALRTTTLHELFARDPARVSTVAFEWNDWRIDVSKERIATRALVAHARAPGRGPQTG